MIRSVILTLILFCIVVWSFPRFISEIPNGNTVPVPQCDHSQLSVFGGKFIRQYDFTVGHANTPTRNDPQLNNFGKDFLTEILVKGGNWSNLCILDSDGDGLTNGEELGDKNCTWPVGTTITNGAISHPGYATVADGWKSNECFVLTGCLRQGSEMHCR